MSEEVLDARNLLCPLPVIRTQDRVDTMNKGDILRVLCTDHGVKNDIPAWCRINGHEVLAIEEEDGQIVVTVRVNTEE
jgi:tRNA 2-thiouridine synthesizing protein A